MVNKSGLAYAFALIAKKSVTIMLIVALLFTVLTLHPSKASAATNLAYGKSVTVSSAESSSYGGQYAVDGNGNTRWASTYADNQYIIVDLGSNQTVASVRLAWEAAYASQYQIQVSTNNSTWTTVYSNYSGVGGSNTITFTPTTARYVKMYAIQRATQYGVSLYEFEIYGNESTGGGGGNVNLAYNRQVTASSTEAGGNVAANAVDANGNTRWSSTYANNQHLIVDLGANYSISSVRIAWEAAYASQYQIQVSSNNSTWTTVYSNYNGDGGTDTINFTPVTARYVKMYGIQRATQYGFSIYEFEVYAGSSSGGGGSMGVLEYLQSISGSQTVIGIHNREPNSQPSLQTDTVYGITGRYPALWSGDFLFSQSDVNNRWNMIYEAKRQWDNGAIVNIMLHVTNPKQGEVGSWEGGVVSSLTDAEWNSLITNGGTLNTAWKQRLDTYATYLQYLEDNGVKVLFRPFHEMNQGIFWWAGRPGSNGTAALYRLTHDYLVNTKGLSNLIWVWNMQDLDLNWSAYNPGNNYWDIFSVDIYNPDGFTTAKYNTALSVAGNKPIAVGECAVLPTASQLLAQPRWGFVMSWAELTFSNNTNAQIQALYGASNVITRDELPDLY